METNEFEELEAEAYWKPHNFSWEEIIAMPAPEVQVKGLLRRGDIGLIYGKSEEANVFAALSLAINAATGAPFARRFPIERPLSVVYMVDGYSIVVKEHMFVWSTTMKRKEDNLLLEYMRFSHSIPAMVYTGEDTDGFVPSWRKYIEDGICKPPDLVFVDTMFVADTSQTASQVWGNAKRLQEGMGGCTLVLVHWGDKNSLHPSLVGPVDAVLHAHGSRRNWKMTVDKLKDFTEPSPKTFQLPIPKKG
jgi:hypothetical protein